jgi:catechol 2,3-dioxygenase
MGTPGGNTMASALRLEVAHTVIYVHDADKMTDFYGGVLGFEVTDRGPLVGPFGSEQIIFLSQTANHHHQVAFITGRATPEPSNNTHHVAFRSQGTLDDLRALHGVLDAHDEVTQIMPLTHGNAWSVYFRDPEFNGVEVFLDTPWHVQQPQGEPLDLSKSNDEIVAYTIDKFQDQPEFGDIQAFYRQRAERLASQS